MKAPLFGMVSRAPMLGIREHYEHIASSVSFIEESLECFIDGGNACTEFLTLQKEVDKAEDKADKIKRNIRNHLPRGLFMPVDKTLFFQYTRSQDNIMDAGQEALNWLGMRTLLIPEVFQKDIIFFLSDVNETVRLLGIALEATVSLIHGEQYDRVAVKNHIRSVRAQHRKIFRSKSDLTSKIYNSDMEFKDIYQLLHFVDCLHAMSHNAETCSDILRAMIAK